MLRQITPEERWSGQRNHISIYANKKEQEYDERGQLKGCSRFFFGN